MSTVSNSICDFCSSNPASCVCICSFPLFKTCKSESCESKHRTAAGLHFDLHPSVQTIILSEQQRSYWSSRIFHTIQAQKIFTDNLKQFDIVRDQVINACHRFESYLARLKEEYLTKIETMRSRATAAFQSAVEDTTANVINAHYSPEAEGPRWIHYFRDEDVKSREPIQLFELRADCQPEDTLRCLFGLVLRTRCGFLEDCQYEGSAHSYKVDIEKLQAEAAKQKTAAECTIQQLRADVNRLEKELAQCKADKLIAEKKIQEVSATSQGNIDALQRDNSKLVAELNAVKAKVSDLTTQNADLVKKQAALRKEREQEREAAEELRLAVRPPAQERPHQMETEPDFKTMPLPSGQNSKENLQLRRVPEVERRGGVTPNRIQKPGRDIRPKLVLEEVPAILEEPALEGRLCKTHRGLPVHFSYDSQENPKYFDDSPLRPSPSKQELRSTMKKR